MLGVVVRSR